MSKPLGRREPTDWKHIEKYPFAAAPVEKVERTLRLPAWHKSHDQGREGSCVGHGCAMERAIVNTAQNSLLRLVKPTRRYSALTIWNEAKKIDEWDDTNPGDSNGTSVRAAYDVLRAQGACIIKKAYFDPQTEKVVETGVCPVSLKEGIKANRWATRVEEMRAAIAAGKPVSIGVNWYAEFDNPEQFVVGTRREFWIAKDGLPEGSRTRGGHCVCVYGASDKRQAFKIKNSWGIEYPEVWLPYGVMQRLLDEYGEAALVTDR